MQHHVRHLRNFIASFSIACLTLAFPAAASPVVWVASDVQDGSPFSGFTLLDVVNGYSSSTVPLPVSFNTVHSLGLSPDSSGIMAGPVPIWIDTGSHELTDMIINQSDGDIVFSGDGKIAHTVFLHSMETSPWEWNIDRLESNFAEIPHNEYGVRLYTGSNHLAMASGTSSEQLYANGGGALWSIVNTVSTRVATTTSEDIVLSPLDDKLYMAEPNANQISVMRLSDYAITKTINVGGNPTVVGIPRNSGKLYVVNTGSSSVSVINLGTETVSSTIALAAGKEPVDMAFSPDGTKVFVLTGHFSTTGETEVVAIDVSTDTIDSSISIPGAHYSAKLVVADRAYTPSGTSITISPVPQLDITFGNVATSGQTTAVSSTTAPALPDGFALTDNSLYLQITSTANWTGTSTVCMNYPAETDDSNLGLIHEENGVWIDRTVSIDKVHRIICANVTSFSPFAVVGVTPVPVTIDIKPQNAGNKVHLNSDEEGLPVAIFGSASVDVTKIATSTIKLAGASVRKDKKGKYRASYKDVNHDGKKDLVVRVASDQLQLTATSTSATLKANFLNGGPLMGSDMVSVASCAVGEGGEDSECEEIEN